MTPAAASLFPTIARRRHGAALIAWVLLAAAACPVEAAYPAARDPASPKTGINKDAMTMQECRDRLATPKRARPPGEDPAIDKDAVCANMLGSDKATHKPAAKRAKRADAASAPPAH